MSIKKFLNKYILKPRIKSSGQNNCISIDNSAYLRKVRINIYGDNNKVTVSPNTYLHNTRIDIGFRDCPINNCCVFIGENTSANGLYICLGESESEVTIGSDCMISFNVEMSCTDTHAITDLNGNLLNQGKFIKIGSKVWICKNVTILKNTQVKDECIIAQNSIVTKCFDTSNCVLAGNPAKMVKEGIKWSTKRPEILSKVQK